MKNIRRISNNIILLLLLCSILATMVVAAPEASLPEVYVIEFHFSVTQGSADYLIEALGKAEMAKADQVIIDLDTYGGMIQDAKRISDRLINYPIPTVVYINSNAQSAGVLISISANEIYMVPTASIGSAETVPYSEKALSMWKSWLRSVSEYRGYDTKIVEAMVDKRIVIDDLVGREELVNLTSKEAVEYQLAKGIAASREQLMEYLGYEEATVYELKPDLINRIHQAMTWPWVLAVLFMIGTGMLFVELFVPGFGIFGIVSIICYAFFFFNVYRGGDLAVLPLLTLVIGIILLLVELFIPGFGIAGIGGIILVAYGIINLLGVGWGLLAMAGIFALLVVIFYTLTKKGKQSKLFHRLGLATELNDEAGFSSHEKPSITVGAIATTTSELRPSGYIISEGIRYDALAEEGSYIEKNKEVRVIKVDGRKIIVREANHV